MADIYFDNVELLAHLDGADGATTYTPTVGGAFTFYGGAELDTAVKKFGTASLLCDGASSSRATTGAAGDFKYIHDGTEAFTIEFFLEMSALPTANAYVFNTYDGSDGAYFIIYTGGYCEFFIADSSGSGLQLYGSVLTTGTNYYIAITYDGSSNYKFYINASQVDSWTAGSNPSVNAAPLQIGGSQSLQSLNGNIDEVRITRGVERSITTIPTEPFSDVAAVLYDLIVNSGSGSGSYAESTVVAISADAAPFAKTFDQWAIDSGLPVIVDDSLPSTSLTTPASNSEITATYTDPPDDTDFLSVELLCNYDGVDGDTSYTSEVGDDPVFVGAAEIDTDWSAFTGGGSLLLAGGYTTFGADADWNWMHQGLESWTIEAVIHPTVTNGDIKGIWDTYSTTPDTGVQFYQTPGASSSTVAMKINDGLVSSVTGIFANGTYLVAGMYDHTTNQFRVTKRIATTNGSYTAGSWRTRTNKTADSQQGRVGLYRASNGRFTGNIEAIRITRGVIRDTDYWNDYPWPSTFSINAYLEAPFIFNTANFIAFNNFTDSVAGKNSTYALVISGTPELQFPISSWQATAQLDNQQYLQCVVPAVDDYVADITARHGVSTFSIYRQSILDDGYIHSAKLVEAPLDSASFAQGQINYSCTISGNNPAATAPDVIQPRPLFDVRSVETSSTGKLRVRCAIDWLVKPGDLVYTGEPYFDQETTLTTYPNSFTASYINYYANQNDSYMDVGER